MVALVKTLTHTVTVHNLLAFLKLRRVTSHQSQRAPSVRPITVRR